MTPTTPADARSVTDLIILPHGSPRAEYLFFWGHRKPRSGVSASCLSQWWEAPFTVDGATYRTAEHYMMAGKARLFGDSGAERRILETEHPGEAKTLGREVSGFEQAVWEDSRYKIVVEGNVAKFSQNPELAQFLVGTGTRVLVEAAPRDGVWGIGMAKDDQGRGRSPALAGLEPVGVRAHGGSSSDSGALKWSRAAHLLGKAWLWPRTVSADNRRQGYVRGLQQVG